MRHHLNKILLLIFVNLHLGPEVATNRRCRHHWLQTPIISRAILSFPASISQSAKLAGLAQCTMHEYFYCRSTNRHPSWWKSWDISDRSLKSRGKEELWLGQMLECSLLTDPSFLAPISCWCPASEHCQIAIYHQLIKQLITKKELFTIFVPGSNWNSHAPSKRNQL